MGTEVDLAAAARLVAEPARAAMLDALLSGSALPAGHLARVAGVSAATASEHLARLREGGWVEATAAGRQRYYRIASPDIAHALEALAVVSPPRPVRSLRASRVDEALTYARTCYDHLAGVLGVALLDRLVADGALAPGGDGYELTPAGDAGLTRRGVDVAAARSRHRYFARPCLDLTQRRPHLAGALGAAICAYLMDEGWLVRRAESRAVRLTDAGRRGLADGWGVALGA